MTEYGKKLFLAKDEAEFRELLEISPAGIWDECQNSWRGEAKLSAVEAKFGTKSLHTLGTTLETTAPVTFGGNPFTIKFYFYLESSADSNIFRALGTARSFAFNIKNTHLSCNTGTTAASTQQKTFTSPATGKWHEAEISYNGSGTLSFKLNNSTQNVSFTVTNEPRRLILGAFNGYVDEFELIDNGTTKALLHFER